MYGFYVTDTDTDISTKQRVLRYLRTLEEGRFLNFLNGETEKNSNKGVNFEIPVLKIRWNSPPP